MKELQKWAKKLNNREYREELTEEEELELEKLGIVVIFGASDDLLEIRGAISEEIGCYDEDTFVYIEETNQFVNVDCYGVLEGQMGSINLINRPYINITFDNYGWEYELPVPSVAFDILEYGDRYCEGRLFYKKDFVDFIK